MINESSAPFITHTRSKSMAADPYNLDATEFAKALRSSLEDDAPEELPHPLLEDPVVLTLFGLLRTQEAMLLKIRKPNGGINDDAYFRFEEGLILRPEIVLKICIDFLTMHPELISQ